MQSVIGNNLLAKDAGTITCTVTIGGIDYTSGPLTLRISGICVVFYGVIIVNNCMYFSILKVLEGHKH